VQPEASPIGSKGTALHLLSSVLPEKILWATLLRAPAACSTSESGCHRSYTRTIVYSDWKVANIDTDDRLQSFCIDLSDVRISPLHIGLEQSVNLCMAEVLM
jgi:hypothetical protein